MLDAEEPPQRRAAGEAGRLPAIWHLPSGIWHLIAGYSPAMILSIAALMPSSTFLSPPRTSAVSQPL